MIINYYYIKNQTTIYDKNDKKRIKTIKQINTI